VVFGGRGVGGKSSTDASQNGCTDKIPLVQSAHPLLSVEHLRFSLSTFYFFKLSNFSINRLNAPSGRGGIRRAEALPQFAEVR